MILWTFSPKTSPSEPAVDGEVLAEDADLAPVDGAETGDDPVGVRPLVLVEPGRPGAGQHVELLERALVEEIVDPLPGGHLALGVLALDGVGWAGVEGGLLAVGELLQAFGHRVL